ncbi:hypothetical protein HXX76_006337 [Chlamydomonas incerta]|uniref:Uncharacterized protein n=1 Tax=Chlamydomonas incerta TaxID=51695 RepID=A0A835TDH2_CHLIN|nr:hypothetical protein HXX76_006337 [Chlamydomonas incerta]|eukprot:KAG2436815.1 hypothetical protein HXX76_006337 [Chlamydomonas incerta]
MPTVLETRVHAKCLRSVDEVRNYFRAYRAQRRADAVHGRDNGRDCGDDGDPDVPAPRGGSRRPGPTSKNGTHKSGVSKLVGGSGRSSRSLGGRAGSSQYGTEEYTTGTDSTWQQQHSLDQTNMTHMTGSYEQQPGAHMPLQHPPLSLPSQQHRVRIHIRQPSAGSGSAGVSSGAFTGASQPGPMGLPRHPPLLQHHLQQHHLQQHHLQQHQYQQQLQMQNTTQLPHSPPDQGGVDGKEGRPDVQAGDMAYNTVEAPCSSVSTASLDDLLRLHDENDMALQDDAAYCAAMGLQQQGAGPQAHGSAANANGAPPAGSRGGSSRGPEGINLKQVMQQRHAAPTLPGLTNNVPRPGMHPNPQLQHHQAYPSVHPSQPHYGHAHHAQYHQPQQQQPPQHQHQQHQQQTQQGQQQLQQLPPLPQRGPANIGDLGSIWDELDGSAEPAIYAQLTLLPRPNIKPEPKKESTQSEQPGTGIFDARHQHQQIMSNQHQHMHHQHMQLMHMQQMQQDGGKPGRVLWSPLLSARPMPVAPQPYAPQSAGMMQHANCIQSAQPGPSQQHMQQNSLPPPALPPFPSGWGLPPLEQQAQQARISLNGSAATPMDGVSCQQDAEGWTRDAAPPLPAALLLGSAAGSFNNGLSALQLKPEPQEHNKQANNGPVGRSGCSSAAGLSPEPQAMAGSAPVEHVEPPVSQPSQPAPATAAVHSLWASEQGGDTEMVASGVPALQVPHNTPTWYTPHTQQQQQPSQPHDAALQQRLLQLQSAGGAGSAGPSPLPTPTGPPSVSGPSAGQPAHSPSMPAVQQPQQPPMAPVPPLPPLPPFPPRSQQQHQQQSGPTPQPSQLPVQHLRSSSSNSGMMTPAWGNHQMGQVGRPLSTSSSCSSWQSVPSAPASVQQPLPVPPSVPGSAASGPFNMSAVRVNSWSGTPETSQACDPASLPRPFDVSAISQPLQHPKVPSLSQPPQQAQHQAFPPTSDTMPGCPSSGFAQQHPAASAQQQAPAAPVTSSPVRVRRFSQPGPDEHARLAFLQQHRHSMQEQLQAQPQQMQQHQQVQQQAQQVQHAQPLLLPPSNSLPCVLPDIRTSMANSKANLQAHGSSTSDGQTPAMGRHVVTTGTGTRPPLMRTLSAPASETPGANTGAGGVFGDAAPVVQGHGTSGSGMALPGVTPRNQTLLAAGAGGFGTPGLGMTSPAGWGDSALAELEGDSVWLRNMLAPDSMTSSLWG